MAPLPAKPNQTMPIAIKQGTRSWRLRLLLSCLLGCGLTSGCQSTAPHRQPSARDLAVGRLRPMRIHHQTLLPPAFTGVAAQAAQLPEKLLLPESLIEEAQVVSPHAEVRQGPGSHFAIKDLLLPAGTPVIVTEAVGPWRKVVSLNGIATSQGWLHHQMLGPRPTHGRRLGIAVKHLPLVVAIRPIKALYTYPDESRKAVAIPKGSTFIALKKTKRRMLVWIAETNSPAWLATADVR